MATHYFFLLQQFVDNAFQTNKTIDHDALSARFQKMLREEFSDSQLVDLLIYAGYIPDTYLSDSSEETLFSKLVEVLVCEWANRMGFDSRFIKQKASYEDVNIAIDGRVLVCDAKSFRLGRSQQAPNVKDFLKLEDIRKWLSRYDNKLGGLVTYPCTHEWTSGSDAYQYCSDKSAPTIMLPYKYLSFLLLKKDSFDTKELVKLWNYEEVFPEVLPKKMPGGNKVSYWNKINAEIVRITNSSIEELSFYMQQADAIIQECVRANLIILKDKKKAIVDSIIASINSEADIETLRQALIAYKIDTETKNLDSIIKRIQDFRMR